MIVVYLYKQVNEQERALLFTTFLMQEIYLVLFTQFYFTSLCKKVVQLYYVQWDIVSVSWRVGVNFLGG